MRSLEADLLTFLVNALWQIPLLAAATWAGAGLLARAPAAYRHRLWIVALALTLTSPLASAVRSHKAGGAAITAGRSSSEAAHDGFLGPADRGAAALTKRLNIHAGLSGGVMGRTAAIAYLLFLLIKAVRLRRAWRRTEGLVRRAEAASGSLVEVAADCAATFGRDASIRISGEIAAPMTFGVRRPVIVLPTRVARSGETASLRGVLAHELAHVVRNDCVVNLACELLALPVSFHPAVRFLRRRISGARETACDEAAAAFVSPRTYAQTLLNVAALASRRTRFAGALGALDGDALEDRMERILDTRNKMAARMAAAVLGAAVLTLALTSRMATATSVGITTEAGPSDMVGTWTAKFSEGPLKGQPAADLKILLTRSGPEIALTLYRHHRSPDGSKQTDAEHPPVVQHSVERGVLTFRTRMDDFRLRPEDPPTTMEADWEFVVVATDEGQLSFVRNSKVEADRARGKDVPPPPPPLPMTRVSKP